MNSDNVSEWNSNTFPVNERYDAWADILNQTYGSWDMNSSKNCNYSASLTTKHFGILSITDCTCDPCSANRKAVNISEDKQERLAIQLTMDGVENMTFNNKEYTLEKNDIFIWDNTQRMSFQVQQRLHKVTIMLPLQRLKNWFPGAWHSIPGKISKNTMTGNLLTSWITSLIAPDIHTNCLNGDALAEATMALLVSTSNNGLPKNPSSLKETQLVRIKSFINESLDDPELSLKNIAAVNNISIRYLHWLFANSGRSVSQYIMLKRLERCRRDLTNPVMRNRTITDIALSWGFIDPTHFSRRFKDEYGETPSKFRVSHQPRLDLIA